MSNDFKYSKFSLKNIIIKTSFGVLTIFAVIGVIEIFNFSKKSDDDKQYQNTINQTYVLYAPIIPEKLDFAGEKVPVENFDVRESLDKELLKTMYWHSETFLYLKRANRFFPIIEPILKKNGIPDDFKFLAVTESGLENVVSPSNAVGYWQFLKATAKEFGLKITDEVDERYDIVKSTEAACKYLNNAYKKHKSWTLVAASYNMGMSGLEKQVDHQDMNSYYDLLLNTETSRYVYRILAYKLILTNPRNYGFKFRSKDLYPIIKTKTLLVDTTITNLITFATSVGTNYKILKLLNPWLRAKQLINTEKKSYSIVIPVDGGRSFDYAKEMKDPENDELIDSLEKKSNLKK